MGKAQLLDIINPLSAILGALAVMLSCPMAAGVVVQTSSLQRIVPLQNDEITRLKSQLRVGNPEVPYGRLSGDHLDEPVERSRCDLRLGGERVIGGITPLLSLNWGDSSDNA